MKYVNSLLFSTILNIGVLQAANAQICVPCPDLATNHLSTLACNPKTGSGQCSGSVTVNGLSWNGYASVSNTQNFAVNAEPALNVTIFQNKTSGVAQCNYATNESGVYFMLLNMSNYNKCTFDPTKGLCPPSFVYCE